MPGFMHACNYSKASLLYFYTVGSGCWQIDFSGIHIQWRQLLEYAESIETLQDQTEPLCGELMMSCQ